MPASVTGTFGATGQSGNFAPSLRGRDSAQFNISLSGDMVGTVEIERSFDNGATWFVCSSDGAGTEASYTAPFSVVVEENEQKTLYRLNCTAYTSGTGAYRISQ